VSRWFSRFARRAAHHAGQAYTFILATAVVVLWLVSGPLFGFSDTWQLVINTGTTVVTFLMVFVIQNTQNRQEAAMHRKIDELITHLPGPRDELAGIERKDGQP
jgi:low affinity Fe/Cu permease